MNQTPTAVAVHNALSTQQQRKNYFGEFIGNQLEVGRNLICQYKYPEAPGFDEFNSVYKRIGPARAIIDKKTQATWSAWPTIRDVTEFDDDGKPVYKEDGIKSAFEQELYKLLKNRKVKLKQRLQAFDRKQLIGRFGGLMVVAKGVNNTDASKEMPPLQPGMIVDLKVYSEGQLRIDEWHDNASSENCGKPKMYTVLDYSAEGNPITFQCHPSRIITYSSGADDGAFYGDPELQACFYALLDWEKIRMASAEGMKKNADQRSVLGLKDGTSNPSPAQLAAMSEDIDDFNDGNKNTILLKEATLSSLNSTMSDPTRAAELCEKEIAARSGMPTTEIFGYQTGRLASERDDDKYKGVIADRRERDATEILLSFIDWCMKYGVLPEQDGDVVIDWPDAREPSQSDKLSMADKAAEIRLKLRNAGGVGESVIPDQFIADILGVKLEHVDVDLGGEDDDDDDLDGLDDEIN